MLAAIAVAQVVSAAVLAFVLMRTGQRLSAEFVPLALLGVLLVALALWCRIRRLHWRLGDAATVGALFASGTLLCGLVACLALRLRLPLADELLLAADQFIGLDVRAANLAVAASPPISAVLYQAYDKSALMCVAVIAWHLATGSREALWRVFTTAMLAMQVTAIVCIFFPARGATATLELGALQGAGLPHGAGTYALGAFERFYTGSELLVRPADLNGIVCFPSFHTVMALVLAQGFAGTPLRWPATIWAAVTIVSTVPMGGHYGSDLVGGFLVWLACAATAESWLGGKRRLPARPPG
ncbi:phosphatase PAP2 family protein [Porphyrobacter sp. GA68]|nr:phosphatase PAP2 family protein [Porphyrobacter sp. GA68]